MKIVLGSDHGGYEYKEMLRNHLLSLGIDVADVGTFSKESCNYAYFPCSSAEVLRRKSDQQWPDEDRQTRLLQFLNLCG